MTLLLERSERLTWWMDAPWDREPVSMTHPEECETWLDALVMERHHARNKILTFMTQLPLYACFTLQDLKNELGAHIAHGLEQRGGEIDRIFARFEGVKAHNQSTKIMDHQSSAGVRADWEALCADLGIEQRLIHKSSKTGHWLFKPGSLTRTVDSLGRMFQKPSRGLQVEALTVDSAKMSQLVEKQRVPYHTARVYQLTLASEQEQG